MTHERKDHRPGHVRRATRRARLARERERLVELVGDDIVDELEQYATKLADAIVRGVARYRLRPDAP